MTNKILIFLVTLCSIYAFISADIHLSLSKSTVGIDETFTAIFSSHSNTQAQPDFSPLEKDFEILSNSQNHSTSIINGIVDCETSWHLELMAKREGILTIPSINFGLESSYQKPIEVKAAHITKNDSSLFLETEITPKSAIYEQTQLVYTIRLYRSVNITQATLSEIKVSDPDAIIERLGNDIEFEHYNPNGTRYVVVERKYIIFPQHAGEMFISPTIFKGRIITGGNSFFHVQSEFKRVASNEEKVTVNPIPAPFQKNNWFAANDVKISEEWSADPSHITLGEPITWTVTLKAEGCPGAQIPTISLNLPNTLKQYLDKPQTSNQTTNDGYLGIKQIKVALIPTKPDTITIPEISINWWNLKTNQISSCKLPARTLHVESDAIAMVSPTPEQTANLTENIPPSTAEDYKALRDLPLWARCLIAFNLVWILALFAKFYKKIPKLSFKTTPIDSTKKNLKKACLKNNPKQAEIHLLAWAATSFPQIKPLNLNTLKPHLSEDLQNEIDCLYQSLYGQKDSWQGHSLWDAFTNFKPQKPSHSSDKNQENTLRELYPTQQRE